MKIVFITSAYYPSIGGVETHVRSVARELVKRGHKLTVITENKQSRGKSDSKASNLKSNVLSSQFIRKKLDQIDIYYFKFGQDTFFKKFNIWYQLFKNRELFSSADIIHAHDVFIWYLPLRFFYWNKKIYTTFHGHETVFPPTEKAKFIRRISEKLSYGNIIIGEFIKKWYGTYSNHVTYGGVNKRLRDKVAIKKRNSVIKLLLIGRLEKDIGVHVYKETLRQLTERGVKFTFTVCGQGSLGSGLEQYGEVLGFVKDVTPYIKKADIVFASSYLSMLQVLQLGTPVFATYTNPLKHDYLRDSPFEKYITISDSAEDLARKVAIFKPNLKKLQDGAKWANGETWQKVADLYEDLWTTK
ncbi:MAG TPA: glycosyltransferase family 4 protein [Candidatus Levybacteria bacterium]|nr:glycosyltransferase family 4 protein [Candidatus Levybacteria bacterium]